MILSPFFGIMPRVGQKVYIDFGDSYQAHPEVEGVVRALTDEHISIGEKRFRLDQCVHIEVID